MASINQIFAERSCFMSEIGKQMRNQFRSNITVKRESFGIDYRVIQLKKKSVAPVILLPGFGSGWEGIAELAFSLACEGRVVVIPSLPGYGNSANPSRCYYATSDFRNETDAISNLISSVFHGSQKFHLVGHSMGAEILAQFAADKPQRVVSLTLLSPAGIRERESYFQQSARFILSGIWTALEFSARMKLSREKDYERELKKYVPKTKSPFAASRILQRLAEARKLQYGRLIEAVDKIPKRIPVMYISGALDSVYPPTAYILLFENSLRRPIIKSIMTGLRHNITLAPDEIVAANIEHYLELAEME